MMLKKALTNSGRRLLKALKKLSTARLAKKLQYQQEQRRQLQAVLEAAEVYSSSPSLDAKSVDTYVTYVGAEGFLPGECYLPHCCCCCQCDENDENQRNENLENEMMR